MASGKSDVDLGSSTTALFPSRRFQGVNVSFDVLKAVGVCGNEYRDDVLLFLAAKKLLTGFPYPLGRELAGPPQRSIHVCMTP
jgi:hypothetical protein